MGFFSRLKKIIEKELKKGVSEEKGAEARYLSMTTEELSRLSDDELFMAVLTRTEKIVDGFESWEDGLKALNPEQKLFYSVNWLETEVNNGGLCQFFVNSSKMVAPLVSEYMGIIGAEEHKKLYDDFTQNNGIDLRELSFFNIEQVEEFEEKEEAYPFDEYDDAFYGMEPLESYLKKYVRAHLKSF